MQSEINHGQIRYQHCHWKLTPVGLNSVLPSTSQVVAECYFVITKPFRPIFWELTPVGLNSVLPSTSQLAECFFVITKPFRPILSEKLHFGLFKPQLLTVYMTKSWHFSWAKIQTSYQRNGQYPCTSTQLKPAPLTHSCTSTPILINPPFNTQPTLLEYPPFFRKVRPLRDAALI